MRLLILILLAVANLLVAYSATAKTLLVVGDSLSAAYNLNVQEGWVYLLDKRLEEQGHIVEVVNASISGETTQGALPRISQLLTRHRPEYVILQLGANDGLRGDPVNSIKGRLAQIIERLQAADAQILLLGVHLPPNRGKRYNEPFFLMYRELAQQYQLAYLPFLLHNVALQSELMQLDGLHPTAAAQPLILNNVWPILLELLPESSN